jgi:hypothetical protein
MGLALGKRQLCTLRVFDLSLKAREDCLEEGVLNQVHDGLPGVRLGVRDLA